ncbi:MAG: glutamine amidotransferase [Clostridiales bacterium]|nr:glutamine amidotransferase [Clostridiales bacterium]
MPIKVLYCGDTQVNMTTHAKGIDTWTFTYYSDSAKWLRDVIAEQTDMVCTHIPNERVIAEMPDTVEKLKEYDVVILSDCGYNNVVLQPGNTPPFRIPMGPDRVQAIYDYVQQGGGLIMVGGWLSYSGMQGKGMYGGTKIEELLPVKCMPRGADDRMEVTAGYMMQIEDPEHPIVKGIDWSIPYCLLGYNKTFLREDAHLIASYNGDVQMATRQVGKGRSFSYCSDVTPHWAGNFFDHPQYKELWMRIIRWTAGALK